MRPAPPPPPRPSGDAGVVVGRDGVRLRVASAADAGVIERLRHPSVAGPYNTFADPLGERLGPHDLLGAGHLVVDLGAGAETDRAAIGDVSWLGVPYGPNRRSVAWKLGITVLPEHRGAGHGSLAQRLLAEHLFATTVTNRVEADTDPTNVAEQRALEKAGFSCEGVLRGAQWRDGAHRDLVLYARLRGDRL